MAKTLIGAMVREFEPAAYKDEYQARVERNLARVEAMEDYVRTAAAAPEKFLISYFGVQDRH